MLSSLLRCCAVLVVALLLSSAAVQAADTLTIVADGRSDYVIALDSKASESETWAAKELADHLKQMSGAELKIVTIDDGQPIPEQAIVLGWQLATTLGTGPAQGEMATDDYLIQALGQRLIIAGSAKRGTMYGVYGLLDELGVRWWTPTETTVPKNATVFVNTAQRLARPTLEYRDMMYLESFGAEGALWFARNRTNGFAWENIPAKLGGQYKVSGNLVHSYGTLLKNSGVEIKDEMYALVRDKRVTGSHTQPCLTNPEVEAAIVKAVIDRYRKEPDLEFVVVGQEDNDNFCHCENCAAIDAREESNAGQVIDFANRVAEAVERQIPGAKIATAAYNWSRKAPKSIRPRDNVYIVLCSIECNFSRPLGAGNNEINNEFKENIEAWSKLASKLFIWHYSGNRDHYLMPNPDLTTFAPNIKFFADHKVRGVFVQGTHVGRATEFAPLRMWLWARAMWNPELNGQAAIEEFCNGYYGQAGPAIVEYIKLIHAVADTEDYHLGRRAHLRLPCVSSDVISAAEKIMIQAEAAVNGDETLTRRVGHARMPVTYVLMKRGPLSRTWAATEKAIGRKLDPVAMAAQFARTVDDYKINYTADPEVIAPWVDWMQDYAKLIVQHEGKVVPPELKEMAAEKYRLIQACQMDKRSRFWVRAEGASDGWAVIPGANGNAYMPTPGEDFEPGKTYRVFARVRGGEVVGEGGPSGEIVVHNRLDSQWFKTRRTIKSDELSSTEWRVFELAQPRKFIPGDNITLGGGKGMKDLLVDCIWIVEDKQE